MHSPDDHQHAVPLETWDWMAELRAQDRDRMWLARRTGVNYRRVYRYAAGEAEPPREWLAAAAQVLGATIARVPSTSGSSDR